MKAITKLKMEMLYSEREKKREISIFIYTNVVVCWFGDDVK